MTEENGLTYMSLKFLLWDTRMAAVWLLHCFSFPFFSDVVPGLFTQAGATFNCKQCVCPHGSTFLVSSIIIFIFLILI